MNEKYRLMIYFIHATIDMYSKNMLVDRQMSVEDLMNHNTGVVDRVFQEAKNVFSYELSHEQMCRGFNSYFTSYFNPSDVKKTTAYNPNISIDEEKL